MDYGLPGSSVHGILQARVLAGLPFSSPGELPDPGVEPGSPALHADTLPSEPPDFKGHRIQSFKNKTNKQTNKYPDSPQLKFWPSASCLAWETCINSLSLICIMGILIPPTLYGWGHSSEAQSTGSSPC